MGKLTKADVANIRRRIQRKAGYDDDLEFLQLHLNSWLQDSNRLEHNEK